MPTSAAFPSDASQFRIALLSVPPAERDAWLDRMLGLHDIPDDGPNLPRGSVPYFPSSVDALLRVVDEANVTSSDVFVDIGSGLGRAGDKDLQTRATAQGAREKVTDRSL